MSKLGAREHTLAKTEDELAENSMHFMDPKVPLDHS